MSLYTYKKMIPLAILSCVLALSGCGKKKKKNHGPDAGPPPAGAVPPAPIPGPTNTTFTNVNGNDYFSHYFNYYQQAYGNIVIVNNVNTGWTVINAGTYSWIQFYSTYIVQGARTCVNNYTNCGNQNGFWGSFNYGYFQNIYSGYWAQYSSSAMHVTGGYATGGASMNITLTSLMSTFYGAIYNTYNSGYYGYYNQNYYYPSNYRPYGYPGNYYGGSFNYNSGNGWNFSFGGTGRF